MTHILTLLGILVMATTSCTSDDPCFTDLESVKTDPVRIDTAILYDPSTFAESCTRTKFYGDPDLKPDSTLLIGEAEVGLVYLGDCYQLLSVKEPYSPCQ